MYEIDEVVHVPVTLYDTPVEALNHARNASYHRHGQENDIGPGGTLPPPPPTTDSPTLSNNDLEAIVSKGQITPFFDHEIWLLAADDEQFKKLVTTLEQTLALTIALLAEHGYQVAKNPLPTAGIIVAGVVCSPYVLGGILIADLIIHHRELLMKSKEFGNLLFVNTPEAMAEVVAFAIETALMHQASTVVAEQYVRDFMPRIRKLLNYIATLARNEEAFFLATHGFGGEKVQLKYNELLQGASDAVKKGMSEGTRVRASLKQAEDAVASGVLKAAKVEVGGSLSKGVIDHATKRHLPAKVQQEIPFQLQKLPRDAVAADIAKRSYFNKNWDREQVARAAKIAFDDAIKAGVKNNEYSTQVFGEKVTVFIDKDGILQSAWGNYKYQLLDFGY